MMRESDLWKLSDEVIAFLQRRLQSRGGIYNPQELASVATIIIARTMAKDSQRGMAFERMWELFSSDEMKMALKGAFDEERRDTPS